MDKIEIAVKLKEIIAEVKGNGFNTDSINDATNLIKEVGIDSLQLINLILSIEDEFEVEIDFETFDIAHLDKFGIFCEFVLKCHDNKNIIEDSNDALFNELTCNSN
jgi:acyl carrier protein